MAHYHLRYLPSGYVYIDSEDSCDKVVDGLLEAGYNEEFCLAGDFELDFIGRLMEAGFLVMSADLINETSGNTAKIKQAPLFVLLPKLHLVRSVLFFPELHIKKSVRPFLSRYELRINTDFDRILDKCVQIHGADWLTPPLVRILKNMHQTAGLSASSAPRKYMPAKPVSFALYRKGELKAGEIGVVMGRVYTSYSGYYEEDNAGMVQIILMTQWLDDAGFEFLDLGMPLDYKTRLGAKDLSPRHFVELFRAARY
jgi:Leu/Phe-tRNA-protein transferase